jgi:predicted nuclease of restriction endonuclease-like RecB superfamily
LLTADLAQVRRRGDRLSLRPLSDEERLRALELAEAYLGLARDHLGGERGLLVEALREIPLSARERRLGAGLVKLVLDRCEFEANSELDAAALRADLFTRATAARRQPPTAGDFDRQAVVAETAAAQGLTPQALEQALYSDLPEAHRLRALQPGDGAALVAAYEAAGVSAVLLRATRVRVRVQKAAPGAFRALFSKLKFLRLLFRIEPLPATGPAATAGYEITIDGPFSLFESVSRYGLALALAYPAIAACGKWSLEADVRWGKERRPLVFVAAGSAPAPAGPEPSALPDDVAQLLEDLERAHAEGGRWRPQVAERVIHLPGAGTIVPDLELVDARTGRTVLVEVLGFWSRDAVWRRVELAERGLPEPMVFAAGKQLRVSEEALPETLPAALYIYKRRMAAAALLERAEAVVARLSAP